MRIPFREISEGEPEAKRELSERNCLSTGERNYLSTWQGFPEPGADYRSYETEVGGARSRHYHKEVIVK